MKKIIVAVFIVLLISIGLIFYLKTRFISQPEEETILPTPTVVLPTVSESIKVNLISRNASKAVDLNIEGLTADISSVEYELTYQTGSGLPRGVLGTINLKGVKSINKTDITLGTCSSGKCVYDLGVTSVNLSLKFNFSSGQSSIFQKSYSLL